MQTWLRRVRHDLVKPLVWPARDLVDQRRPLVPADLGALQAALTTLIDDAGAPIALAQLWQQLRASAPSALPPRALECFEQALLRVEPGCQRDVRTAVDALLGLEPAFAELARISNGVAP